MPIFFALEFQINHFLWLVFSLLLGIGYAGLLYSKSRSGTALSRRLVFILRALAVAMIAFLLFAPQVRSRKKLLEKPVIILAQDNSASLTLGPTDALRNAQYRASMKDLYTRLSEKYQVDTVLVGDSLRNGFNTDLRDQTTDLSSMFEGIEDRYAGRNVGAIILASDGLYNRGGDPLGRALSLKAPVYSIGLGDTSVRKDVRLVNVNSNELVQAGNEFEIAIQIEALQAKGQKPLLRVHRGQQEIFSKVLNIDSDDFRLQLPVILPPQPPGIKRYTIRIDSLVQEVSLLNNSKDFYVRAQDTRKAILIIAGAPHPDISAIKQSLMSGGNYDVQLRYGDDLDAATIGRSDLLILYQVPSQGNSLKALLGSIKGKPILYVLGTQSDLATFSSMQSLLDVKAALSPAEATATVDASFSAFTLPDSLVTEIPGYSPLTVPSSDIRYKGGHIDLLYQTVGGFKTGRPLLSYSGGTNPRMAVLGGEGIWRWRLEAFKRSGNHRLIDQLLGNTVRYLVADEDRRRFRVYHSQDVYTENEQIILNAELYNEAFELVNAPDVSLTLRGRSNQIYSYQFSRLNRSYALNLGVLPAGEYTYEASTRLGDKLLRDEGVIRINSNEAEFQEVRANHQLLYQLGRQSGGALFFPEQAGEVAEAIELNELVKTVAYERTTLSELIDMKWLSGLIFAFLFCEWFMRKRSGEL